MIRLKTIKMYLLFVTIALFSNQTSAETNENATGRYHVSIYQDGEQIPLTHDPEGPFFASATLKAEKFELTLPRFQCATDAKEAVDVRHAAVGIRTEIGERAAILKNMLTTPNNAIRIDDPDRAFFKPATGVPANPGVQTFLYYSDDYDVLDATGHAYFIVKRFFSYDDTSATISIDSILDFNHRSGSETELLKSGLIATLFIKVHDNQCIATDKYVDTLTLTFE